MNKLFEVYSKGLLKSLEPSEVQGVIELFEAYTDTNKSFLGSFFKNKTIAKSEKLAFALDLFGTSEELKSFIKTIDANNRYELLPGGTNTPINYEVSSSVLGGIILKYKDNEIDLSIDNKINGLQTALIN